jgi:hypothetical protein
VHKLLWTVTPQLFAKLPIITMHYLISAIVEKLELELSTAVAASQQARDSATHSENIAANRYDTLAVEAAYLAHGQSSVLLN